MHARGCPRVPGRSVDCQFGGRSARAFLRTAREDFAYVVVDAGAHSAELYESLFEAATTIYLVTQVGVAELRNANRFISWYFSDSKGKKLEIVLNRFVPRNLEIDEAAVTKVL